MGGESEPSASTVTGKVASLSLGSATSRIEVSPASTESGTVKEISALPLRVGVPLTESDVIGKVPTEVSPTKASSSVFSGDPSDVRSTSDAVNETSSPAAMSVGWSSTAMAFLRKSGSTTSCDSK